MTHDADARQSRVRHAAHYACSALTNMDLHLYDVSRRLSETPGYAAEAREALALATLVAALNFRVHEKAGWPIAPSPALTGEEQP